MLAHTAATPVGATCSCPPRPAPYAAVADSHLVFAGRVTQISQPLPQLRLQRMPPYLSFDIPPHAPLRVRFEVTEQWRGRVPAIIEITTARFYSSCGVPFQINAEYLVYGYYNGAGDLMTHRCSRTSELALAAEDRLLLGRGAPPLQSREPATLLIWLVVSAITGITLIIAAWRRFRSVS
ncbi:MAG TPA: hypothetical protein PKA05_16910 [Roseiflexaceae bacterium]|nr:hypothetical protein [Roseiflexaceae bacterium]